MAPPPALDLPGGQPFVPEEPPVEPQALRGLQAPTEPPAGQPAPGGRTCSSDWLKIIG